jgi:hypothetical protein
MDINDATKNVNKVDKFLTAAEKTIKKHWLILMFIIIGVFVYWAWNLPEAVVEEEVDKIEYVIKKKTK